MLVSSLLLLTQALATPLAPAPDAAVAIPSLAPLVQAVEPAVVSIEIQQRMQGRQGFVPPMFEEFFGPLPGPRDPGLRQGEGSGFVISEDGLLLTNAHVVRDADELVVRLSDGSAVEVEVLGRDDAIDVALLQLPSDRLWPYVALGGAEELAVGDWVVAMGNPLGLGHTVTAGIVSGKSRVLGQDIFGSDDFIQTDAAINQGNSGGPLFDLQGRVVGMNTAIIAGANTVGFAIPSTLILSVLGDLKERGHVARGFIGLRPQTLTAELAEAVACPENKGALVSQVFEDTPAEASGLRVGDVVVDVDGQAIEDHESLIAAVGSHRPGDIVTVQLWRGGKKKTIEVTLAERPTDETPAQAPLEPPADSLNAVGVGLQPLPPALAAEAGIAAGVLVERVDNGSPADQKLRPGDILLEVNQRSVNNPADVERILGRSTGSVSFLVLRSEVQLFVSLSLP
jgi:serine protease Do